MHTRGLIICQTAMGINIVVNSLQCETCQLVLKVFNTLREVLDWFEMILNISLCRIAMVSLLSSVGCNYIAAFSLHMDVSLLDNLILF